MRKLIALPLVAVAIVGAAAGFAAGPASAAGAAGSTTTIKQDVRSYTSPSDSSVVVHRLKAGMEVEVLCFRDGWFLISKDGEVGYIERYAIDPPSDLPSC